MSPKKTYTVLSVGFLSFFFFSFQFDVSASCIALAVYLVIMGLVFLTHKVGYALEVSHRHGRKGQTEWCF